MKLHVILILALAALGWQAQAQIYDTNNVVVETFAGSGFSGFLDGVGQQTMFNGPSEIVGDSFGNLFVLDSGNSRIRKIAADGTVSTFAGGGASPIPGYGTNVSLSVGVGTMMAIDHSNVLWLVAGDLLRVSPDAYVSKTFVLTNFTYPASVAGVCADSQNNLYLSTWGGNQIYRLKTNGVLELFAGSGNYGSTDGNGIFTSFAYPAALAADTADNIYVSDAQGRLIRRINQNRDVVTVAGRLSTSGVNDSDGVGTNATFYSIAGMSAAESGDLLLACGSSIRRMGATTSVTTLAGRFVQYNETGYQNGPGILALFNGANAVCIVSNSIFVADFSNQRIRQITFNPSPQPVLPANLQLATYPGLQITGTVGRTYQIQSSPDMNTWNTIATLLLTSSPYLWIDQNPARGSKFYRAWLLP